MKSIHSLVLGISLLLSASFVQAQTYNLSLGQYPPCSTNWDVSGTTYTCNGDGRVTLPDGAHVIANTTVIIVANNGFSLNNNTVGSADHNINLRAAYGSVNAVGSNIIHGNVTSTGGSTIMLNGTVVAGDVTTNGHINLVGGSVGGKVTSFQNTITTNNTDLNGGAQANSGMNITGGTISGDLIMTALNGLTMSGVTMTEGVIETPDRATITDSTLGSSSSPVAITVDGAASITLENSTVYGDLWYPSYANGDGCEDPNITNGKICGDSNSQVIGDCYRDETLDGDPPSVCKGSAFSQVAYYQLSHAPTGLTCMAEAVTIRAYDENHQPVAPPSGTQLVLDTAPATGAWVGGNTWVFSGTELSIVKYLQQTSPGLLSIVASDGAAVGNSSLEFLDTALKWYGDNPLHNPIPIPAMTAGDNSPAYLWAVRTNTDTGACEGRVEGPRAVDVAFECRNPDSCVAGQSFTVNGSPAHSNPAGGAINYAAVPLNFDASGVAAVALNYSDVGQVQLHAQVPLPASDNDPAITLSGSSNEFVVKPHTLAVSAVTSASNVPNPGTTSGGTGFVAAGELFHAQIEVRNAQGDPTPNFGNEAAPQVVRVDFKDLVYPAGGNAGTLSGTDSFAPDTTPGRFISQSLSWNEVGSIEFSPALVGNDYLGAGAPVDHIDSGTVGRFYPSDFHLVSHSTDDACTGFSYLSQPQLGVSYRLEARAQGGNVTTNYDTLSYTGTAGVHYVAEHNQSGDGAAWTSPSRLDIDTATWVSGVMQLDDNTAMVRRLTGGPDGPYDRLQLGLQLQDDLDNRSLNGLNLNPFIPGSCLGAQCTAIAIGEPLAMRFGRLRLDDAYGPETMDLPAGLMTQYWDGEQFVRAQEDSCTHIQRTHIHYPEGNLLDDSNRQVSVGGGISSGQYSNLDADGVRFFAGNAGQVFSAPGAGNTGRFDIRIDLSAYPWLRFDWTQSGDYDQSYLPPANIGFGSYRGHDRVIYWREVFE